MTALTILYALLFDRPIYVEPGSGRFSLRKR